MNTLKVQGYSIDEIHSTMLEIAVEIDRICNENNIKYILDGGSMLGAIRHNGFIPWDHDLDVAMRRKDYERFRKYCKQHPSDVFFFSNYKSESRYSLNFGKMRKKNTSFLEIQYKDLNLEKGVFVDVFPIDNIILPLKKIQCLITAYFYCVHQVKNGIYDGKKKWLYWLFSLLPFYVINNLRDITMRIFNWLPTKYCYKVCHPGKKKPYYDVNMYENIMRHKFEDKEFYIPVKYDEFLKKRYGNYMELPPKEEQETTCGTIIEVKL